MPPPRRRLLRALPVLPLLAPALSFHISPAFRPASVLSLRAPPGSGYQDAKDDDDPYPEYEPTMEYPGTMRPGKTPENAPFHDLPNLNPEDPDPVPWPHFQEIDWHHEWGSARDHPVLMEDFIEELGRWATFEDELEVRRSSRRGVRDRMAVGEGAKENKVLDDSEEDDEEEEDGSLTGEEEVAMAIRMDREADAELGVLDAEKVEEEEEEEEEDGDGVEDLFLELGLDAPEPEEEEGEEDELAMAGDDATASLLDAMRGLIDEEEELENSPEEDVDLALLEEDVDLALLEEDIPDLVDGAEDVLDNKGSEEEAVVPLDNLNDADELEREVDNISYDDAEYDDAGFDLEADAEFEGDTSDGDW